MNKRRRLGVDGGPLDGTATGRVGECGRLGEGGVTSVCRIELNMALACSLSASDSEGIILFLEGVDGPASSMR